MDGHPTPGDGHTTPHDGHRKPGDGHTTPRDGHPKPGDGHNEPGDDHATPHDGHPKPGDGHTTPRDGHTTPCDGRGTQPPVGGHGAIYRDWTYQAMLERIKGMISSRSSTCAGAVDPLRRLSVCFGTAHGPSVSTREDAELKRHLEVVLKQVQNCVKSMGMQPVALETLQPVPIERAELFTGPPKAGILSTDDFPRAGSRSIEAELKRKEDVNSKLVEALQKCSSDMKSSIAARLASKDITPEFAQEVAMIIQCMDRNVKMALDSGGHFFDLPRLLEKLSTPVTTSQWFGYMMNFGQFVLHVVNFTDRTIKCIGTSHVKFSSIGKETNTILCTDYTSDKLSFSCDAFDNISFGAGGQLGGGQSIGQLLIKLKNEQNTFSLNLKSATNDVNANPAGANGAANAAGVIENNDIAAVRISHDRTCGKDLKCVLEIPYPSFNGKVEVRHQMPYLVSVGGIELIPSPGPFNVNRSAVLNLSAVLGVKDAGVGAHFQIREGQLSSSVGLSVISKLLAVGLTYKRPDHYKASICKEMVGSSTTFAAQASYSPWPAQGQGAQNQVQAQGAQNQGQAQGAHPLAAVDPPGFRFTVGMKHSFDTTLYCKARIGTDGASVLLKKSSLNGTCSVKGSVHVDFRDPLTVPKMGVVCSFRW